MYKCKIVVCIKHIYNFIPKNLFIIAIYFVFHNNSQQQYKFIIYFFKFCRAVQSQTFGESNYDYTCSFGKLQSK